MSTPQFNDPAQPGQYGPGQVPGGQPPAGQYGPPQGYQTTGPQPPAGGGFQPPAPAPNPDGGRAVVGPFTLRDSLFLLGTLFLVIAGGVAGGGFVRNFASVQFLVLDLLFPLAVGAGFIVRRVSPQTRIRAGSFSLDQTASVLGAFSLLNLLNQLGLAALNFRFGVNLAFLLLLLIGSVLVALTTVFARLIPVFAADFTGRPESPAHVVARDAVPATRPAATQAPAQQYPSAPGYGAPQNGPAPFAPQGYQQPGFGPGPHQGSQPPYGYQPGSGQQGWATPVTAPGPFAPEDSQPAAPAQEAAHEGGTEERPTPEGSASAAVGEAPARETPEVAGDAKAAGGQAPAPAPEPAAAPVPAAGADEQAQTQGEAKETAPEGAVDAEAPADVVKDAGSVVEDIPVTEEAAVETDLLKQAEAHVSEAPKLAEPVLGVPELHEDVEDEEPLYEDDPDATVLRSALIAELNEKKTGSAAEEPAGLARGGEPSSAETPSTGTHSTQTHSTQTQGGAAPDSGQPAPAVQQAFWFAVPERRTAVDERNGAPVFDILPGKWVLALQEGPQGFVVQNEDGRIGLLREVWNIERGS